MTIEAMTDIDIRLGGQLHRLKAGQTVDLPSDKASLLLERARGKVRAVIQPGMTITWEGADGSSRGPALIDFLHTDADGRTWAFVTLSAGWAAVN